jgi:glycosyltransferase involved in cell wall biosynthesis
MRILHVFSALAPRYGWAHDMMAGLCAAQAECGHEVTVFSTNLDWDRTLDVPLDQDVDVNGVTVRYFPVADIRTAFLRKFAFSGALLRALRRKVRNFDVVHIHGLFLFPTLAAAQSCRVACVPYVVSPYGILDPFTYRKSRTIKNIYWQLFARRDVNNAAAVHFMTKGELDFAAGFRIKSRTPVVELGIDVDKYHRSDSDGEFASHYPVLRGKRLIVYLGRISYSKGLDLLARAFALVASTDPGVALVLVGPDHEGYGSVVRQILAEQGVDNRALFTGMIPEREKIAALWSADIFCLPSYVEGFGIAMIEAMACERPVVITTGSHMKEAVLEADAGLVVECTDEALAAALKRLLDDGIMSARMGRNGRALVDERFTWRKVADRMLQVYVESGASN